MTDIHPMSGSSYPELAQNNPLDPANHPDTVMPDTGNAVNPDGSINRNSFAGQYLESKSMQPMVDSMRFNSALSRLKK